MLADESEGTVGGSRAGLTLAKTGERIARVPGTGLVFCDAVTGVPPLLAQWLDNIGAAYECTVLVTVRRAHIKDLGVLGFRLTLF